MINWIKERPLMLSVLALPLILLTTMAIAGSINSENLLTAAAINIGDSTRVVEHESSADVDLNPFGVDGLKFEGDVIDFAYPTAWSLDSSMVKQTTGRYVLAKERGDAAIAITVKPVAKLKEGMRMADYLVDGFRSEPAYERYFLRQLVPVHIGRTTIEQVQYAAVTSTFLSENGLKSERGIKAAFVSPGDQLITVNLHTFYDNSYGNYLQVDALKPIMYDIIGSILTAEKVRTEKA